VEGGDFLACEDIVGLPVFGEGEGEVHTSVLEL
jgi:hypothetical protein